MTFLILDELKMKNQLARFMIGTSTMATILLFTLASIANSFSMGSNATVFGPYLVLFRIGMLFVVLAGLAGRWSKNAAFIHQRESSWLKCPICGAIGRCCGWCSGCGSGRCGGSSTAGSGARAPIRASSSSPSVSARPRRWTWNWFVNSSEAKERLTPGHTSA
jgi:hypothetical protein